MRIDRQDLYALLRARNIPYEETAHPAVWSMEELHALCLPGEERILKNLFLQDDKKRRYYLVAIDGGRTADLKALRRTLDSRPLRFADAADLERLLGLLPGQVTPLGALRAPAGTVTVVLDASAGPDRGRPSAGEHRYHVFESGRSGRAAGGPWCTGDLVSAVIRTSRPPENPGGRLVPIWQRAVTSHRCGAGSAA